MSDTASKPKRQVGLSVAERLHKYRVVNGDCWETSLDPNHAYPQFNVNGRKVSLHRAAFEMALGPIPSGSHVLHRCDNPRCHRPSHLVLGTAADNMRDMVAKGRHRTRPKLTLDTKMIVNLSKALSQAEIAECVGVSQTTISLALRAEGKSRGRTTSFNKGHGLGGRR